ncbi:unnamed protein product, partial [Vitis vinifera]
MVTILSINNNLQCLLALTFIAREKKFEIKLLHCDDKFSVCKFGTSDLSLNFWWQTNDTSLVPCFHQQFRSSPILLGIV